MWVSSNTKVRLTTLVLLSVAAVGFLTYRYLDNEAAPLTEEVRSKLPGSFVRLSDGVVHYQFAGSPDAPVVVLVHGFSVPYYLWDPLFDDLRSVGFRVLRYDLFGRGYSDRPRTKYDERLFERQLSELLTLLRVNSPIQVGGSLDGRIDLCLVCRSTSGSYQ